ncbi:clavesin-2-like [Adelges cooleyi]|uniref:clavesin-2-like n=1 Tax=Adelges cooleyi TaxID=133065 RepID=UPI00217F3F81|nr:clavesin-2-like [Adelges cooleyi]
MESKTLISPTPSAISQMYSELGTTETKVDLDVKFLKEWMRKQPHLPNPDDCEKIIDEKRIKMFLLMCKNSLEKTKTMLDQHYTIKNSIPEYYSDWDPTSPEIINAMKLYSIAPLPNPTHEGHRVGLYCARTKEDDTFVFNDLAKLSLMSMDLRMAKLDTFKKIVYIFDLNYFSMNLVTEMLSNIKKFLGTSSAAYPTRIHEVHIVNMKSYIQPLVNIIMSVTKNKFSHRLIIHKSVDDLKNSIDPSILPLNYGGTYPKTSNEIIDDWYDELVKHREWLMTQSTIVADDSKRPKNSKNNLVNFENAMEGSFRKLGVD